MYAFYQLVSSSCAELARDANGSVAALNPFLEAMYSGQNVEPHLELQFPAAGVHGHIAQRKECYPVKCGRMYCTNIQLAIAKRTI
jgi:hypothetical protein